MTIQMEHIRSLTTKGQVTIPVEIRRFLGLEANDRVIFRIVNDHVEIEAAPMSLEDAFGSVQPLRRPEDFAEIRQLAREERAERSISKQ